MTLPSASAWRLLVSVGLAACGRAGPPPARPDTTAADTLRRNGLNQRRILAAAKVALPPPGITPADLPEPGSEGARDIAGFCQTCHSLPTPVMHSATDWPSVARRMWLRMDLLPAEFHVPVPTVGQRRVMLDYLIAGALEVSGATLPEGPGRGTFSRVCSRCHALPDPRQHSAADWPTVVMRMEQHMNQMNVEAPGQGEVSEILLYLDRVSGGRRPTR